MKLFTATIAINGTQPRAISLWERVIILQQYHLKVARNLCLSQCSSRKIVRNKKSEKIGTPIRNRLLKT